MLILLALLLELFFATLLLLYDWHRNIPAFLAVFFAAFAVYLIAAAKAIQNKWNDDNKTVFIIFAAAILFRLTILWTPPTISEDFYRYVWDGRVQTSGIHPYRYPPDAPELHHLRNEGFEKINYKRFNTPYPPFAELVFYGIALVSTNIYAFKIVLVLFDIFLIEVIRRLLRKEKRSPALLLIYAWHPLAVVEFAGSSHMDVIGISALMIAILLSWNNRHAVSGAVLAAACMTKYLPAAAAPWLLKQGRWKFTAGFTLTLIVLIALYYDPQFSILQGVSVYYRKWRFNDSLFGIFYNLLGGAEPARRLGAAIALVTLAFCYLRNFSVYRSLFMVFGAVLLLSPVVHPWYLCWVLPLLVFHPNRAWIFFSGWIVLAYLTRHFYPNGLWKPVPQLQWIIYGPFFVLLAWDFISRLFQTTSPQPSHLA